MNQDENSPWRYKPDGSASDEPDGPAGDDAARHHPKPHTELSWQAAEFIEHHHGPGWYLSLAVITAALAAIIFLVLRDYFATAITVIVGIIVGVFAGHKPSVARYEIDASGLSINGKSYPYSSYKSFAILHEGALGSINLIPLKRFMPPVAAYFEPKDEASITEILGEHLPLEQRRMDTVDKLSRRLRL